MTSPSNTEDVGTLIARLREATGASKEFDRAIAKQYGWHRVEPRHSRQRSGAWIAPEDFIGVMSDGSPILDSLHGTTMHRDVPDYTASIDAALTLVPDNVWLEIKTAGVTPGPNERLYPVVEYGANDADHTVQARTIPLALCIAALLARQSP